jgi:hypothetical protein
MTQGNKARHGEKGATSKAALQASQVTDRDNDHSDLLEG